MRNLHENDLLLFFSVDENVLGNIEEDERENRKEENFWIFPQLDD